ncbi:MAG: prolyl aminopeptidase [Gammaproteobacteria bacterium]|nr:prolyl aminopeptidase [Gammaproteobacteria bacterium]
MHSLYPEFHPYREFFLDVSDGHSLYVEQSGSPWGIPVLVVHGGPGGGCSPLTRRFFDPTVYNITMVDQRGAGRSQPHASLAANTTTRLVADFETLRKALAIDSWLLFGGSWGSTLSLVYAQTHPQRVRGMILRGIFLGRPEDMGWLFEAGGASRIFPDYWRDFTAMVPPDQQDSMVAYYYGLLSGEDELRRLAAAKAWAIWEARISTLEPQQIVCATGSDLHDALAIASIECHYARHDCFLGTNQILQNMPVIETIPGIIVHGRYDMVCPMDQAQLLYDHWPASELHIVRDAGHSQMEPGIIDNLVTATRAFAPKMG